MKFIFTLLDIDYNGILGGTDLLTSQTKIEATSEFTEELQHVINHYVRTHLMVEDAI